MHVAMNTWDVRARPRNGLARDMPLFKRSDTRLPSLRRRSGELCLRSEKRWAICSYETSIGSEGGPQA